MKFHERFYFIVIYILYFLYFLLYSGIYSKDVVEYIYYTNFIARVYICGFLLIRFNPFRSLKSFTEYDRNIVFHSAVLLLISLGLENLRYVIKTFSKIILNLYKDDI